MHPGEIEGFNCERVSAPVREGVACDRTGHERSVRGAKEKGE